MGDDIRREISLYMIYFLRSSLSAFGYFKSRVRGSRWSFPSDRDWIFSHVYKVLSLCTKPEIVQDIARDEVHLLKGLLLKVKEGLIGEVQKSVVETGGGTRNRTYFVTSGFLNPEVRIYWEKLNSVLGMDLPPPPFQIYLLCW